MHRLSEREVPRCRTDYQITLRETDSTSETYICFTRPTRGVRKARLCGGCSTNVRAARYFSNRAAVIARCSRTGAGCRTITYIAGWLRAPNCINTSSSRPGAKVGRYWVLHGRGKGCLSGAIGIIGKIGNICLLPVMHCYCEESSDMATDTL